MTDKQWQVLLDVINGELIEPMPIGFIIDCPWLPGWYGITILDYFTSPELWFQANLKAVTSFPDIMFFPGFWSEFGMCTEPSAFGARCVFTENGFPHAHKVIKSIDEIRNLDIPEVTTDGLLPFMINRLKMYKNKIEETGHKIRFSMSRGPLNVASYIIGMTEFLTAIMTNPDEVHDLLKKVTIFLKNWHKLQRETFPTIDGILILDDIIGFIGEDHFKEFALPYLKELFDVDVSVKFLHNDAPCKVSAKYLPEIGVNLFNMGFDITLNELKELTGNVVTLLGNIPPRDVLAQGKPEDVKKAVVDLMNSLKDRSRVILSCGGGMPPGVSSENISAFIDAVKNYK